MLWNEIKLKKNCAVHKCKISPLHLHPSLTFFYVFLLSCCGSPERGYTRSSEYLWSSRKHFWGTKRLRPVDSSITPATRRHQRRALSLEVSLSRPRQIDGECAWATALNPHGRVAGNLWGRGVDYITLQLPFLTAALLLSAHFICSKHFHSKGWKIRLLIVPEGKCCPQLLYVHVLHRKRLKDNVKDQTGVQHFWASLGQCLSSVLEEFLVPEVTVWIRTA